MKTASAREGDLARFKSISYCTQILLSDIVHDEGLAICKAVLLIFQKQKIINDKTINSASCSIILCFWFPSKIIIEATKQRRIFKCSWRNYWFSDSSYTWNFKVLSFLTYCLLAQFEKSATQFGILFFLEFSRRVYFSYFLFQTLIFSRYNISDNQTGKVLSCCSLHS